MDLWQVVLFFVPWYVTLRSAWPVKHRLVRLAKAANTTVKGTSKILSLPFSNDNIWQLHSAYIFPTLPRLIHYSSITSNPLLREQCMGWCILMHTQPLLHSERVLREVRVLPVRRALRPPGRHVSNPLPQGTLNSLLHVGMALTGRLASACPSLALSTRLKIISC